MEWIINFRPTFMSKWPKQFSGGIHSSSVPYPWVPPKRKKMRIFMTSFESHVYVTENFEISNIFSLQIWIEKPCSAIQVNQINFLQLMLVISQKFLLLS